jgi:hypothetical protein
MAPLRTVALVLFSLGLAGAALAHGYKKNGLEIIHPWTMETSEATAKISMTIRNKGKVADRLIAVKGDGASTTTLQAAGEGEAARSEPIVIPAGGEVVLGPKGTYVELGGLTRKLSAYDRVHLELEFEQVGKMAIEVMVEERDAP